MISKLAHLRKLVVRNWTPIDEDDIKSWRVSLERALLLRCSLLC